jgi:hypothetical protein
MMSSVPAEYHHISNATFCASTFPQWVRDHDHPEIVVIIDGVCQLPWSVLVDLIAERLSSSAGDPRPHEPCPQQPAPSVAPALSAEDNADIALWSAEYGRPVSKAEVDEINKNLLALVDFLIQNERDKRPSARA